jgi:hypothetical protein
MAFTTTINAFTSQAAMLTTQLNNHANNNNRTNQNRGGGPIRAPRGRNNRIIEDSSFSKLEDIDVANFEYIDKIVAAKEK